MIIFHLRTTISHILNFICAEWHPQPKGTVCFGACRTTIIPHLRTLGVMQVRVSSYLGISATNEWHGCECFRPVSSRSSCSLSFAAETLHIMTSNPSATSWQFKTISTSSCTPSSHLVVDVNNRSGISNLFLLCYRNLLRHETMITHESTESLTGHF